MPSAIRILIRSLNVIVLFLVITGGYIFDLSHAKIDLSNVGPWAAALLLLYFWSYKKFSFDPSKVTVKFPVRRAVLFLVLMCGLIFLGHCLKHWSLHTHGYDVSFVHQALFYPVDNGLILKADISPAKTVLGDHLTYSFLLLSPFTKYFHSDEWIFLLQVLLVGSMLWLLLAQGPLRDHRELFLAVVLIILSHRGLRSGMFFDFREDVLAFVGLSGMILALLRGSIPVYLISFLVAILSKENVFAAALFFAIPIWFSQAISFTRQQRIFLIAGTTAASLIYAFISFKYLIPMYTVAKHGGHPLFARFGFVGKSVPEIVFNILVTPKIWFQLIATSLKPAKIKYLVAVLGPFAFFVRSREALLWASLAIPGILMNICHDYTSQIMMVFHYELILLPGLIAALLFGIKDLLQKSNDSPKFVFWGVLIALCFSGKWPGYFITANIPTSQEWTAHKELKAIGNDRLVAVDFRFSAQVNHLRNYQLFELKDSDASHWSDVLQNHAAINTWILDPQLGLERKFGEYLKLHGFTQKRPDMENGPVWILVR